jgi:hypothetical protein
VFHTPRKFDRLITYKSPPKPVPDLYAALSPEDASALVEMAVSAESEFSDDLGRSLAVYTDHDLSRLQSAWVQSEKFWPAIVFRGAPPSVRDRIIASLKGFDGGRERSLSVNHALCALAWIGDEVVQQVFAEWERQPPSWRKTLHVGPTRYAHQAAWNLRGNHRRNLSHPECWAISTEAETTGLGVKTFADASGTCPWCERRLINMIEIDLRDERWGFLEMAGPLFPVLACEGCTYYAEHLFARVDANGVATWHEDNVKPKFLPKPDTDFQSPWRGHRWQLVQRGPRKAVECFSDIDLSQIGGMPGWVQDTAFPKCPDCGDTMTFIAQLDNSRFKYHEGVHYAFLCTRCRVTATAYQQT